MGVGWVVDEPDKEAWGVGRWTLLHLSYAIRVKLTGQVPLETFTFAREDPWIPFGKEDHAKS